MDSIQKFQELLKRLFQFEASDLDFGIYRILNYKRDRIEKFIEEELRNKVETAFSKHKDERLTDINQRFEEVKKKVIQSLGQNAFTPTGELKEEFKNTPLGREFLSVKAQKDEAEAIDEIKLQVFNDLYNFFSRYYEEGDFVPQYRYSIKAHKYAIPYNGEEVKLYWANQDQYYTKTGLLFRDYTFKASEYRVIFRVVFAKEELGSNKATKERFFVLDDENPVEVKDKEVIIHFQYRELTEKEVKDYEVEGGSNVAKQEKINQRSYDEIIKRLDDITLKGILSKEYKNEKPLLLYQISRFTAKNTKDYFIHKNLKKFLSEQLDYFIKSEVLDIETLEKERFLDKHITRAKVVREIGEDIIDFLSQIEDFQKRLWEKKKFVLKTEYVITLDKVKEYCGEEFLEEILDEILRNEGQLNEWEELGFGKIERREDLFSKGEYKKLPIDTKYFSLEFKERLLEKLTENRDLDDILDGLLIKSENWQALNTILNKYKEKVQTIYIDPPFNKEQDADYLYNVKYKDSTWASMLENRLRLARDLLNDRGSIFVRCDYNGNWLVRPLMNEIFGEENFRNEIVVGTGKVYFGGGTNKFNNTINYLLFFSKNQLFKFYGYRRERYEHEPQITNFYTKGDTLDKYRTFVFENKLITLKVPEGYHWKYSQDAIDQLQKKGLIIWRPSKKPIFKIIEGGKIYDFKYNPYHILDWGKAVSNNWTDIPGFANPPTTGFETENTEILLKRVIESTSNTPSANADTPLEKGNRDIIMDFFLGSGTTTAVAHKLGRKWIGIEMGEHFWTVVLPRMKKVLAYDKSGISKELKIPRQALPDTPLQKGNYYEGGGFFKYQILEQYEDTLDNIELKENQKAQELFKDEYLLKYFLDFETRESPYLLNIEMLKNPFAYKLKVNLSEVGEPQEMVVDIPETFNYLLGIKVKKIKFRNTPGPSIRGEWNIPCPSERGEEGNSPSLKGWQAKPDGVVKWKDLPFNPKLKEKAKELRKAGNLSEVLFWQRVNRKQLLGLDFDRQKIIGNYIVDFYCKNLGVVIEIDGITHEGKVEYDEKRENYLKSLGLKVIHILDSDVKKNLEGVMKFVEEELRKIQKEMNTPGPSIRGALNTPCPSERGEEGNKYLFILGEKEGKDIAIVWREYNDNWKEEDFKEDKEFINKELESWKPSIVYVNGQSILTPKNWEVKYIEPEFKKLMER